MNLPKLSLLLVPALLLPVAAHADACVALTGASSAYYAAITTTQCNTIITINADGTTTVTKPNTHPYDGSDDNYVGVINNSASGVSGISLSSTAPIFGFDGDGIDAYGVAGNAIDKAKYGSGAYGGPDAFFTGITSSTSGVVNFITPIAAGGTGYFSLEAAPNDGAVVVGPIITGTPEPSSLLLLATGALGVAGQVRRRIFRP